MVRLGSIRSRHLNSPYPLAQLNDGLDQIRVILGPEGQSELSDTEIKDALWNNYFDIDVTLQWALGTCAQFSVRLENLPCLQTNHSERLWQGSVKVRCCSDFFLFAFCILHCSLFLLRAASSSSNRYGREGASFLTPPSRVDSRIGRVLT